MPPTWNQSSTLVGVLEGAAEGSSEGRVVGTEEGIGLEGRADGLVVGDDVGVTVGMAVGWYVGSFDGSTGGGTVTSTVGVSEGGTGSPEGTLDSSGGRSMISNDPLEGKHDASAPPTRPKAEISQEMPLNGPGPQAKGEYTPGGRQILRGIPNPDSRVNFRGVFVTSLGAEKYR